METASSSAGIGPETRTSGSRIERSVVSAKAVVMVYENSVKEWRENLTSSPGVSKVQIYRHQINNTFRVVARNVSDHQVTLNVYIGSTTRYNKATPLFHQWRDAITGAVYGLNFTSSRQAEEFAAAMFDSLRIMLELLPQSHNNNNNNEETKRTAGAAASESSDVITTSSSSSSQYNNNNSSNNNNNNIYQQSVECNQSNCGDADQTPKRDTVEVQSVGQLLQTASEHECQTSTDHTQKLQETSDEQSTTELDGPTTSNQREVPASDNNITADTTQPAATASIVLQIKSSEHRPTSTPEEQDPNCGMQRTTSDNILNLVTVNEYRKVSIPSVTYVKPQVTLPALSTGTRKVTGAGSRVISKADLETVKDELLTVMRHELQQMTNDIMEALQLNCQ